MEGADQFPVDNIPEVWLNVYDKLDPKDKLAFSGASSVLHDWVEPKRTESLISEVAPYLIEPCDPVHLGRALQARELCQSWKEAVDQEIQTHGSNTSLCFEIAASEGPHWWHPSPRSRIYGNDFHVAEDVQEFMQEMRTHPGNPFPGRSIGFHFRDQDEILGEEWRDYWSSIILLLETFGSSVHFAVISLDGDEQLDLGNLQIQATLRECLLRLPNLRQVAISCEFRSPLLEDEIREYYTLNPLPQLEYLETVEVGHTSLATLDEVLNGCCVPANIKRVSVHRDWQEGLPLCEAVYGFENLEVLESPVLLRDLERFSTLERRPPLRELDLTFAGAPYFEEVFSLLEPFVETLIQVESRSRMRSRNDVVNGELFTCNLPHLRKLVFVKFYGTADLLFQFKSLTHVEIARMRDDSPWGFPGFNERLVDSSIWTLMPCLQWLSLADIVFKRHVMEQRRQDWMDNHDTTGIQERTWYQECRSVLMELVISFLIDSFAGILF